MIRFCAGIVVGLVTLTASSVAHAGDFFPPPWRGLPNTTVQGWNFIQSPSTTPNMAPLFNPYTYPGMPFPGPTMFGASTWTPATPAGAGIGGLFLEPGAFIDFFIPNNFDPTTHKEIWIQIKFSGPTPGFEINGYDANGNFLGVAHPPTSGPGFTQGPGPYPNSSELVARFEFDFNPAWETIRIRNTSTGQPLFIYQVVIDTICPTPGTAAAGLIGVGLMASRRRR